MTKLNSDLPVDMECAGDAEPSMESLDLRLQALEERLSELPPGGDDPLERARVQLEMGGLQHQMGQQEAAWENGHEAFKAFLAARDWEDAVQACEVIFKAEKDDALPALGQGIWLGVTYPIDPQVSIAMLEYVVDETPNDSDGAAVAAAVAHYIGDLRARDDKEHEDLAFYTGNLLAKVARRHSNVEGQEAFNFWIERLELNDPAKFLPRLRNVVDVLVQEEWWFDREALQAELPVH